MSEHLSIEVVRSDVVPPGTFYLGAWPPVTMNPAPLHVWQDPWPDRFLPEPAATHRQAALDHLAGLLDGLCADLGLDPDRVWRAPKIAEQRRDVVRWRAEERVALAVNRPGVHVIL